MTAWDWISNHLGADGVRNFGNLISGLSSVATLALIWYLGVKRIPLELTKSAKEKRAEQKATKAASVLTTAIAYVSVLRHVIRPYGYLIPPPDAGKPIHSPGDALRKEMAQRLARITSEHDAMSRALVDSLVFLDKRASELLGGVAAIGTRIREGVDRLADAMERIPFDQAQHDKAFEEVFGGANHSELEKLRYALYEHLSPMVRYGHD